MGDGEPSFGGLAEIRANLVKCLALGVTTGKGWDGGRVATGLGFRAHDRGERDRDINDKRWSRGSGVAHGRVPPTLVV